MKNLKNTNRSNKMDVLYAKTERMAGILLHPTSLPSKYGIGDMGRDAYTFVDFLAKSGQKLWQILPLGPTGYGDSPYQSFSAFAGQPLIISPDALIDDGLLSLADVDSIPVWYEDKIDYGYVLYYKTNLYKTAFANFLNKHDDEYYRFVDDNIGWLDDYAAYMAIKDAHEGKPWLEWEEEARDVDSIRVKEYKNELEYQINYYKFLQYEFYKQWTKLRSYASSKGIRIVGDIPIFVSIDSADAWANRKYFQLDEKGYPIEVSGVPPDYFSSTGQLWGNPLYDWKALEKDKFSWWIDRIKHQLELVDYLRIDHFRGFEAYWSVPYGEKTAINGQWISGPYYKLFDAIEEQFGHNLPIFAEDLGIITPQVEKLRDAYGLPGMKVLQFAFDSDNKSPFLPHQYHANCICYTGTHDNDTTKGWFDKLDKNKQNRIKEYTGTDMVNSSWDFIRLAYASTAKYAIIPMQDILEQGSEGRMNTPGKSTGNWTYRVTLSAINDKIAEKLLRITNMYNR